MFSTPVPQRNRGDWRRQREDDVEYAAGGSNVPSREHFC
jgi:hypothetical protein